MSKTEFEDEFEQLLAEIEILKGNVSEDEQKFVDSWISKIRNFETEESKAIHLKYLNLLKAQLIRDSKHLSLPFVKEPPDSQLIPLQEYQGSLSSPDKNADEMRKRYIHSLAEPKPPCPPRTRISKPMKKQPKFERNDFEDPDEMAICIARSKGKLLPEFVADISRHTSDKGQELRAAMKAEVTNFSEFVQRIMSQHIKDLTELLDDKHNQEIIKYRKKYDQWQSELLLCKTELKGIVPDFDLNAYKKDKNYFKRIFSVSSSNPPDEDKFKEWREENCHRLMWFSAETSKLLEENNKVAKEIAAIKMKISELKQRSFQREEQHNKCLCKETVKCKVLQQKSDKLSSEIANLLISLEN